MLAEFVIVGANPRRMGHINRIEGIGASHTKKLEAALKASNGKKHQVHLVPGVAIVARWVEEAKKLPRVVIY
jgi:hypothetical protein